MNKMWKIPISKLKFCFYVKKKFSFSIFDPFAVIITFISDVSYILHIYKWHYCLNQQHNGNY